MTRRRFLALAAGAIAVAVAWLGLGRRRRGARSRTPASFRAAPLATLESREVFLSVADVVVPREGGQPAASEIGFSPLFEAWVVESPEREALYARYWPTFEAEVRARVPMLAGRLDAIALGALLESWYASYRSDPRPADPVQLFEALRRDVLRVYWGSPQGWAAVGYTGPARELPEAAS